MLRVSLTGGALLAALALVLPSPAAPEDSPPPAGFMTLTPREKKEALKLTEDFLKAKGLWVGKIYLTRIDVFPSTKGDEPDRMAVLLHYRYQGNLAILTSVDLARNKVLKVETDSSFPTPLAPEEEAEVRKLTLTHPEVKKQLAAHGGEIEAETLPTFTIDKNDPTFNHRAVQVMFRKGLNYLDTPRAHVDLTTGKVMLMDGKAMDMHGD